jgi:serine phosphatase RsbU (regulator of sigma subunit)
MNGRRSSAGSSSPRSKVFWFPLDGDRYGFLLADMEGHGLAAALYAMQLSSVWNQHFQLLTKPSGFAAQVNKELVRIFGRVVTFATAVCGVMDELQEELLKFSNDIRLQDDITIIEVRFWGQ